MLVLLTGGGGPERDVSFMTAKTIAQSLRQLRRSFAMVDVGKDDWQQVVLSHAPEVAILAIHGHFGEGGQLQSWLEEKEIPFTGSSSIAARQAFDKRSTKARVAALGIATPKEFTVDTVVLPVVVKPNHEGSSIGVSIVRTPEELPGALETAGEDPLIEEYIEDTELTCAVTDVFGKAQALPLVEIVPAERHTFFDYEAKYVAGEATEFCPARISDELTTQIQEQSLAIFEHLELRQYCRIDWMLRGKTPYFLEVNTIPGMTPTSLINKELAAANISFDDFIAALIQTAHI